MFSETEKELIKALNVKIKCDVIADAFQYYIIVNNKKYALCLRDIEALKRCVKYF